MDKRKTGYSNKAFENSPDDYILSPHHHNHHRIPYIQTKNVDNVVYSVRRPALVIRGGCKKYGSDVVLQNLNMFAKEGTIYCLVGAGNSGKSTVLSCIIGLKRLTKGEIHVFGAEPGTVKSGIPGRRLGYMPQSVGLHTELTITEVIQYYGRMYGLTLTQIKERTENLQSLLDLQSCNTRLLSLSPGLQKRASLACALIHEPELIVLDQPTTGMDILIQKGIWSHLQKIVSNGRTSVILTTQNIEESRQAHRVGVLRSGRLLVEDSPSALLQKHGTHLLAEVVAKLSVKDTIRIKNEHKRNKKDKAGMEVVSIEECTTFGIPSGATIEDAVDDKTAPVSYQDWMEQVVHGDDDQIKLKVSNINNNLPTSNGRAKPVPKTRRLPLQKPVVAPYPNPSRVLNRLRALFINQFTILIRNYWMILFNILLPSVLITIFCLMVGPQPQMLKIGLVNEDGPSFSECMVRPGCINDGLSCRYLEPIPSSLIDFMEYEREDDAIQALQNGNILGYLYFLDTFSKDSHSRIMSGLGISASSNESSLKVVIDESNIYLHELLRKTFTQQFERFEEETSLDCNMDPVDRNISVLIEPAFAIDSEATRPTYNDFFVPGISFLIVYFTTLFTNGLIYQRERREGLISRAMAASVNSAEVLFTHLFYQIPILAAQVAILVVIPMFVFNISINGFWGWGALLIGLGGVAGTSLSYLLAILFKEVKYIFSIGTGSLIVSLMFSGILWPVESQHWIAQWIGYVLPWTLPTQSLRSITIRGWGIEHLKVWEGFVAISSWTFIYWFYIVLVLSIRYFRR